MYFVLWGVWLLILLKNLLKNKAKLPLGNSFICCLWIFFMLSRYINLIHCDTRDHYSKEESTSIKELIKTQPDLHFSRYIHRFQDTFGEDAYVPAETTCCWCLMDDEEEYIHHQFLINITASIAMDISLHAFLENVTQVGSTFFGLLFKHCSSCPLWISRDVTVRVTPPNGTMHYNFAWGNHAARKTNNAANAAKQKIIWPEMKGGSNTTKIERDTSKTEIVQWMNRISIHKTSLVDNDIGYMEV